jgi:hypothetical protein
MLRLGGYMNFVIALAHIVMFFAVRQIATVLGMPVWLGKLLAEGWVGWFKFFLQIAGVVAFVSLLGLYGLSGAGRIRRLPLLRTGLLSTGAMFTLLGAPGIIFTVGALVGGSAAPGFPFVPLYTLTLGLLYLVGTIGLWKALAPDKGTR